MVTKIAFVIFLLKLKFYNIYIVKRLNLLIKV